MLSKNRIKRLVPSLTSNNRRKNLEFYEKVLGMTNLLEEGAIVSLGDKTRTERLVLEEIPGNRARKVEGPKKLVKVIIRVADSSQIEALLARGISYERLYQGPCGYAFEAVSPEGDVFLLHAEEELADLVEVKEVPAFKVNPDFAGLSHFEVESLVLHVPDGSQADFYEEILQGAWLDFVPEQGADLLAAPATVWDVSGLRFLVEDFDVADLQKKFAAHSVFIPKSGKFFVVKDQQGLEVWIESV